MDDKNYQSILMKSLNEELQTVNIELQRKITDFMVANNDMKNLLNSTDIATLFLDKELHIRRFTDQITHLFKLRPTDVGRPFTDMVTELQYPEITAHAKDVLRTLIFIETDIPTHDQKWFKVRIMPYRTYDDHIDGLVITFIEITKAKILEEELATANKIERGKRASDLVIADQEVIFQHDEKVKLQAELNKAIELLKKHNLYEQ
jgi:two-component system, chemotaxis family, CheB/CheR fusion protein